MLLIDLTKKANANILQPLRFDLTILVTKCLVLYRVNWLEY